MASKKQQNAMQMDPQRFQMAKNMSVVPGGPMNNNPENVMNVGQQAPSMSGMTSNPYNDAQMQLPQMGADILNPQMVKSSGLQQNMPIGQKLNATAPYGQQPQPSANVEEPMEGMRLGQEAQARQLYSSEFMGPVGTAALMPGALDPTMPASTPFMPTSQQMGMSPPVDAMAPDAGGMVPGSTPQKVQKKKGKK